MIESITLHQTIKPHFTNKLYHNKKKDVTYEFTDGINIITGRNGSGKSVLLKIIKTLCGLKKDGTYPSMPSPLDLKTSFFSDKNEWNTIPEYIKSNLGNKGYPSSDVVWDGAIIYYFTPDSFNPTDMWNGMVSRGSLPQKELFSGIEILEKIISTKSQGESSIQILTKLYQLETTYDLPLKNVNDMWLKASDIFQEWLASFPKEKSKPTLLIDELDEHLDLDNQKIYWDFIGRLTKKWQVIVVSHSIFAFRHAEANHIKLNPEYFNKVKKL
jgi:predicted ATP-dependent endonuclease of OLD family